MRANSAGGLRLGLSVRPERPAPVGADDRPAVRRSAPVGPDPEREAPGLAVREDAHHPLPGTAPEGVEVDVAAELVERDAGARRMSSEDRLAVERRLADHVLGAPLAADRVEREDRRCALPAREPQLERAGAQASPGLQ